MAFKLKNTPYPYHNRFHKEPANYQDEKRTRQDDELEENDKRRDRWNPEKQARLEKKAAERRRKADEALERTETEGKGYGRAYRTEKRAQKAEKKARLEAAKRGRDGDSSTREPKGIKSIKGSGRKGLFGRDKKALSRWRNK